MKTIYISILLIISATSLDFIKKSKKFDFKPRQFLSMDSLKKGREELPLIKKVPLSQQDSLPENFDSRFQWPNCTSIGEIYDQGACGDCWAVSATMTATDRWCIAKNQTENPRLSVEGMVGCCKTCGYGCADGFPNYAWAWLAG